MHQLFDNAWKFTQATNTAKIEFGCDKIDEQKVVYVRDNGVDFDMQNGDTPFKPFHHSPFQLPIRGRQALGWQWHSASYSDTVAKLGLSQNPSRA